MPAGESRASNSLACDQGNVITEGTARTFRALLGPRARDNSPGALVSGSEEGELGVMQGYWGSSRSLNW